MTQFQRRHVLFGMTALAGAAGLAACSTPASQTAFDQAKAYFDAASLAILASAQAYLAGPPVPPMATAAMIQTAIADLERAKAVVDGTTAPTDWKAAALQALAVMQQLNPLVAAFEGPAAPAVTLAIAVVQAFIASLPPPPATPTVPPAALMRQGAKYHPHAE